MTFHSDGTKKMIHMQEGMKQIAEQNCERFILNLMKNGCQGVARALMEAEEAKLSFQLWDRETREKVVFELANAQIAINLLWMKLNCRDELEAVISYQIARTLHEMQTTNLRGDSDA